ncbi:RNA polymerase sigma-54 factor [Buttiauxella agrestis ATCC 33320]|uniref:RNA polymerase sigma-54 factor n=1 Tax=Buttiauxella agrestis ATCC 33320 TaxID=1006004 RepID=A0A085GHF4_9ENTR|nr:RNA polymerase sigma-54 factor [Buttiauxella agrestis ATCC 33320]
MEAKISSETIRKEIAQYLSRLWRYGLVLSHRRDVADDLVQATCVRALERAPQFIAGSRMDRWLFSILHSIWINEVRAQQIRRGQGFVDVDELVGEEHSDDPIWSNDVMKRVNRLPEAQRNTVFLVYVEELSYREAAVVLNVPVGTVMSRLATARLTLAQDTALQASSPQFKGEKT